MMDEDSLQKDLDSDKPSVKGLENEVQNSSQVLRSRKTRILLLILIFISCGVALLVFSKNAQETTSTTPITNTVDETIEQNVFADQGSGLFAFNNGQMHELDSIFKELEDYSLVSTQSTSDFYSVRVDTERDENGPSKHSLFFVSHEGEELLFETTESLYLQPSLSRDGKKVAFFADKGGINYTNFRTSTYIGMIDTAESTSSAQIVLDNAWSNDYGPLLPLGWAPDNKTIFLRDNGCLECHGGSPSTGLYSLHIETQELKQLFGAYESDDYRRYSMSQDGSKIVSIFDDFNYYGGYDPGFYFESEEEFDTPSKIRGTFFEISVYDVVSDSQTSLYKKSIEDDILPDIIGWSLDNSKVLVKVNRAVFDQENTSSYTTTASKILVIDIESGATETIDSASLIEKDNTIGSAVLHDDTIYFTLARPDIDGDFNPDSYSLHSYDRTSSTRTLLTERTESMRILPIAVE